MKGGDRSGECGVREVKKGESWRASMQNRCLVFIEIAGCTHMMLDQ